jgi:gliding motility-associated-like protein
MLSARFCKFFLLIFINYLTGAISLFAQEPAEILKREAYARSLIGKNASAAAIHVPFTNQIQSPVKNIIRHTVANVSITDMSKSLVLNVCKDSSFKKPFYAGSLGYNLFCSSKTIDGGIILGGTGRDLSDPPPNIFYGMIIKMDSIGNFIWSKELRANGEDEIFILVIQQMKDGSIIISGTFDNTAFDGGSNIFVAKLTSAGNTVWVKTFKSVSLVCTDGSTSFIPMQIEEGANGDILLSGSLNNCTGSNNSLIYKLDLSGVLKWSTSFQYPFFDGTGFGLVYENNKVKLLSRAGGPYSGSDNVIHIDAISVDYNTGTFLSYKSWQVNIPFPSSFVESFSHQLYAGKLDNGNYCVYGELFGDYQVTPGQSHHFAVLEFNANDNFVKGFTINSGLIANADGSSSIKIDRSGRVVFSLFVNYTGSSVDFYIGSIDNGNIFNQRQRYYSNSNFYIRDNWELFSDRSYVLIKLLGDIDDSNERLEYSKLHDSDTSSLCLGINSDFCFTSPTDYIPYEFTFANIISNALSPTGNGGVINNLEFYIPGVICSQINSCDSLKIHGSDTLCNLNQDFIFTAYKNPQCGSRVQWIIDTGVVSTLQQLNDTTIKINFKTSWQGYLYAILPASCSPVKDSIKVNVFNSPDRLNLGPDTSICTSNTIILNAHEGYSSYQWQDASVDSTFTVTSPGTYFVKVAAACGGVFRDTIIIKTAPPVAINIGPDRIKCNSDTIQLAAPSGFLNYAWNNNYNISSLTSQNVIVNPTIDTSYYIKAEKTPGCFAYDTVKITVQYSTAINLGPDKSFCVNDSAVFNAGSGFIDYQWNTGLTSQQIIVKTAGTYTIMATTAEGCKSYDTVKVLNVFNNPSVSLDHNSFLCIGSNRTLDAGNFISYSWNTGSSSRTITVNDKGIYSVLVTDNNGCKGNDTTIITGLLPPPSGFLPPDTAICSYGTLVIQSIKNFKDYLWSNNAKISGITISQPGIYWLQVTDDNNCIGKDSVLVNPKDCLKGFYIPSAFTPNNDGKNDVFRPLLFGNIKKYQFTIYNRWSQKVFQTIEPGKGWDGIYTGHQQDTNMFVWICSYQLEGEEPKVEKGTVFLAR